MPEIDTHHLCKDDGSALCDQTKPAKNTPVSCLFRLQTITSVGPLGHVVSVTLALHWLAKAVADGEEEEARLELDDLSLPRLLAIHLGLDKGSYPWYMCGLLV